MALVNFKRGNFAAYTAATKSADTLYFVTDEHRIYMGEVPYSGGIYKEVTSLPATGEINTIYKVTDTADGSAVNGDVAYWDGTKYVYLLDMSDIQAKANAYADGLNTAMDSRVKTLETAVGSGGSVDSKIQAAIEDLDADIAATGTAAHAGTFVAGGIVETDGKITDVKPVEVEAAGAAAAAQTAAQAYADTKKSEVLGSADTSAAGDATVHGALKAAAAAQTKADDNAKAIDTLNADATTKGSVDYKIAHQASSTTTDLGKKADKVTGATEGHFAGLDANGNLTDSGSSASSFDAAGAAAAVLGATDDTSDKATVYGVKAYAKSLDDAMDSRVDALESSVTGLSGAMHFKGVYASVEAVDFEPATGDVIAVGEKEYVYVNADTKWAELGDTSKEGERIGALETAVGTKDDTAAATGSIYARIAQNVADIDALERAGSQANVLEGVQVNGIDLTIGANKKVNVKIAEGTKNGTVKVNGSDVAVHGLGSAAYTNTDAYDAAGTAAAAVAALDVTDKAVAGQYVSAVSETDGKITVTRTALPAAPKITTGTANGTIAVDGTNVAVKGLGSAAYTQSSAYATAAQGTKADQIFNALTWQGV